MEKLLMTSGVLTSIILCLVGIVKLPITKFKEKKWYKPLLTIFTLILIFAVCSICQAFILCGSLLSWSFLVLCALTVSEVMVSYNGIYEGCNLKTLIHNLVEKLKELKKLSPEEKVVNKIEKLANKYDLTKLSLHSAVNKVVIAEKEKTE